jgi:hypothetical protein
MVEQEGILAKVYTRSYSNKLCKVKSTHWFYTNDLKEVHIQMGRAGYDISRYEVEPFYYTATPERKFLPVDRVQSIAHVLHEGGVPIYG